MQNRKLIFTIFIIAAASAFVEAKHRRRRGKWGWNDSWSNKSCTNASGVVVTKGDGCASVSANDNGVNTKAHGKKGALSKTGYSNKTDAWRKSNSWWKNKNGSGSNNNRWRKKELTRGKTKAAAIGNASVSSRNGKRGAKASARGNKAGWSGAAHEKRRDNYAVNKGWRRDRCGNKSGYSNKFITRKDAKTRAQSDFKGYGASNANADEDGTSYKARGSKGSGGRAAQDINEDSCGVSDNWFANRNGRKGRSGKAWGKRQSSKAQLKSRAYGDGWTLGQTDQEKGIRSKSRGKRGTKTAFGLDKKDNNWSKSFGWGVNNNDNVGSDGSRRLCECSKRRGGCKKALARARKPLAACNKRVRNQNKTIENLKKQLGKCEEVQAGLRKRLCALKKQNKTLRWKLKKCRNRKRRKCGCVGSYAQ